MKLRLGGVPEHFNYMWHLPAARELLRKYGIVVDWTDYPGGTGAMARALEAGEEDMVIMLTEGAVASIAEGKDFKIWFPYVMSPLLWGVFTSASRAGALPGYQKGRFAVSRLQSGSHLMAKYLAQRSGVELDDRQFVVSQDLGGARKALATGAADYFLWEKYMTRPLVRSGEFAMVDEISAPWPSFVFVSKRGLEAPDRKLWRDVVYEMSSDYLINARDEIINGITEAFNLEKSDAEEWLGEVRYYDNNRYWKDRLIAASMIMHSKGMISRLPDLYELTGSNQI